MSLVAKQVSLQIADKTLLDTVNFSVEPGQFIAIVGPNGAGKSSLFKVLTREHRRFKGSVELNGKLYTEWKASEIALQIGVLPQSSTLNFAFTAFDVVNLGRMPHSSGRIKDQQIATQALAKVDALHLANHLYPSLSGGEKQRVQLARVLAQIWEATDLSTDRYLLLDEPTSALDLAHQHLTLKLAKQLSRQGVGVVAILHDLNLAAEYADSITMLKHGRVFCYGSIDQVMTASTIKAVFDIDVTILPHPQSQKPIIVGATPLT